MTTLSNTAIAAAQIRMVRAASSNSGQQMLENDVQTAIETMRQTLLCFQSFIIWFPIIGKEMATQWWDMNITFEKLSLDCKDLTRDIAGYGKRFNDDLMYYAIRTDLPAAIREAYFRAFMNELNDYTDNSQSLESGYNALSQDLLNFRERYSSKSGQFATAQESIEYFDSKIIDAAKEVHAEPVGIGITSGLIPSFGSYILLEGTKEVFSAEQSTQLSEKLGSVMESSKAVSLVIAMESSKAADLAAAMESSKGAIPASVEKSWEDFIASIFMSLPERIKNIRSHIAVVQAIWSGIKGQCVEVLSWLQWASEDETNDPAIILAFLEEPKSIIGFLADLLLRYCAGIRTLNWQVSWLPESQRAARIAS